MYITRARVCFHANIFKWETVHVLSFNQMSAITKERTAKVIPNAIQVRLCVETSTKKTPSHIQINLRDGARHFFTTFTRRDRTYQLLFRLWRVQVEMKEAPELEDLLAMVDANNVEPNDSDTNDVKVPGKKFSLQHKRVVYRNESDRVSMTIVRCLRKQTK